LSNVWYYADYKGQIGPVKLQQLKDALARVSEPANVLVWRDGFTEWKPASDVPEFRAQTLSPPPLPVDQMPTWQVKWWWYIVPFISNRHWQSGRTKGDDLEFCATAKG
jgi:hypothetical protein